MRIPDMADGTVRQGRFLTITKILRLWASLAIALGLLMTGVGSHGAPTSALAVQDSTPDAEETPDSDATEEGDETPAATEPGRSSGPSTDLSLTDGQPAVLAQGLTYITEGDKVWTMSIVEVPSLDDAVSEAGPSAIFLQRQGSSIIRNDVTGKRVKLEPGEAFYRAPDDKYTISADGSGSTLWSFSLVDPAAADKDARYEGRLVKGLDEAAYDLEMVRYILAPGDTADLPDYNGTGLTMVLSGEIEVRGKDAPTALAEGDGQTMLPDSGSATVSNSGSDVAMYVFISLGDEVSDDTAGAGTGSQTDATVAATTESETTSDETPDTDVQETPEPGGSLVTSINVIALAEIYITVTVDGTVAYDGTLASGQSTGPIVGATFEVYTSSGVDTQFTNACGVTFSMGSETGAVTYNLAASADSCAP